MTLIELLVVVLIVALLGAVALTTFLGGRESAQDRVAQSNVRSAASAQAAHHAEHERFTSDVGELIAYERGLDWHSDAARVNGVVADQPTVVQDDGVDRDGDGNYQCNVSTSNGVTTVEGDCAVGDDDVVCLASRSPSGAKFVLVRVASGDRSGTYYGKDIDCPSDRTGLDAWSTGSW